VTGSLAQIPQTANKTISIFLFSYERQTNRRKSPRNGAERNENYGQTKIARFTSQDAGHEVPRQVKTI